VKELQPGDMVGPYRVDSLLGEGGMGRVYKAYAADDSAVALKLVKGEMGEDPIFRRRFDREVAAAAGVRHDRLVPVLETGEHEGVPFMVQEFVQGGSLADRIAASGALDLGAAVRLCNEVAQGLDALHQARLVHRDLKPANILLDPDGSANITDFGLAKHHDASVLTKPGQAIGSLDYMAPEQIRGEEVSATTDVYALGCVMFECLSGAAPFAGSQGMRVMWAHLHDDPGDPCADRGDVPSELGWAVTRALEKEPSSRPPSAMAYARMVQMAAGVRGGLGGET
jgi:serine/threonine protein kinase